MRLSEVYNSILRHERMNIALYSKTRPLIARQAEKYIERLNLAFEKTFGIKLEN